MENTFITNHLKNISELKSLLIGNALVAVDEQEVSIFLEEEILEDGTTIVSYTRADENFPRCKIVQNEQGIFFYEKKDQSKD